MFVSASLLIYALVCASGIKDALTELFARASLEQFGAAALPRIAAACAVSAFSAQLCRSAGDEVTAWAVEVLGTVTAVLISLPLWQGILELFLSFL